MHAILFKFGSITIYTYGVFVFLGVITVYTLAMKEAIREGVARDKFSNLFFWTVIWSFVGGRLLYIIVEWKWFIIYPFQTLFSRSGFVFYGGVIAGLAAFYIIAKKHHWCFLRLADIIAIYIPLGHALGRLGCFSYGCCYGKPTTAWLGLCFPSTSPAGASGLKVIPTQLISAFFLIVIFFILLSLRHRRKFPGQIFTSYLLFYGIFRFIIEFFRGDPRGFLWIFSTSQWISIAVVIVSIISWPRLRKIK